MAEAYHSDAESYYTASEDGSTVSSAYSMASDGSSVVSTRTVKKTTTMLGGVEVEIKKKKKRKRKKKKDRKGGTEDIDWATWEVIGSGECGIAEMQSAIPDGDNEFYYGMIQIAVGSGRFERSKNLFIEFNGISTPPSKKSLAAQKRPEVQAFISDTHATISFEKKQDVTISTVFERVGHLFVADNITGADNAFKTETTTIEQIQKQYEKEMAKRAQEYLEAQRALASMKKPIEPKKKDRIQEILSLLHEDMGWVNWVLFKATQKKLKLYKEDSFGAGTIFALRQNVSEKDVLFGILRLSFGVVPYRRTHFVLLHWVGPKVNRIKRGTLNARAEHMAKLLEPWGIKLELKGAEQITVENIIRRVRKIVVVDGHESDPEEIIEQRLIDEFNAAMKEEEAANAKKDHVLEADKPPEASEDLSITDLAEEAKKGKKKKDKESEKDRVKKIETTITESVTLIGEKDEKKNWILVCPKKKRKKKLKTKSSKKFFQLS